MSMIIWIQICTASWTVTTEIYKNNSFHIIHESVLHTKGTLQGTRYHVQFVITPICFVQGSCYIFCCLYLFMSIMSDSNMICITT